VGKRILFVEDDASFSEIFALTLREALAPERLDVAFVEAGSLAEARAQLREGSLDAALIDVTMPDGEGLELVGEIHDGGVFNKGEGDPTSAAVLAFVSVYLGGGVDPVLYLHPRFRGDLPETLTSIERRSFDPVAGSVNMVPSGRPGFMKGL
jgi:CheY-like chemotaxis protein